MKNKIDEIFRHIAQKHQLDHLFEKREEEVSDLQKGSFQRRNPFDPRSLENKPISQTVENWHHSPDKTVRDSIPRMEGSARNRALNKIAAQTQVKKHPETGERMFLMHRGYGPDEADFHQGSHTSHPTKTKTSWSLDPITAEGFAGDYGEGYTAAWIPESAIHSYLPQYGGGSAKFKEHETVVDHSQPFEIAQSSSHKDPLSSFKTTFHAQAFPHKYAEGEREYAAQKAKEEYQQGMIDQKIQHKDQTLNSKSKYRAKNLKQIQPRTGHKGQYGWMAKNEETDLQKGSLQRRNPFNPKSEENEKKQALQRMWTHEENDSFRQKMPAMEGSARLRALNKLAARTHTRKHPETGERLFLMHRGMGDQEHQTFVGQKNLMYPPNHKTSWSPDKTVADSFGGEGMSTVSAWIPESALVHSPNQFNAPVGNFDSGKTIAAAQKTPGGTRSLTEKEEQEWIVNHTGAFDLAHPEFVKRTEKNKIVSSWSKPHYGGEDFRARIGTKQQSHVKTLPSEDRDQAFHDSLNAKSKIGPYISDNKDKLAASEKFPSNMQKSIRTTLAAAAAVAVLGGAPNVSNTDNPISEFTENSKPRNEFGTRPEDHFLHNIMQVETSGGKNTEHPLITYGMHKGTKAIGKFALMPKTIKELAKRRQMQPNPNPKISEIHKTPIHKIPDFISKNPDVELSLARTLARHVLGKHGYTPHAAYAWKYGHNMPREKMNPEKLNSDPYIQKFQALSVGESVDGLEPADNVMGPLRHASSIQKSEMGSLIRRGILLTALAGTAQQMSHQLSEQKEQERQAASERNSEPPPPVVTQPTEPEVSFKNASREAFKIAAKNMPLSVRAARKAIAQSPSLEQKHGYILDLPDESVSKIINKHPELKADVADHHFDSLHDKYEGDMDKIFTSYSHMSGGRGK